MKKLIKYILIFLLFSGVSCTEKEEIKIYTNLQEYINLHKNLILDEVIACAASDSNETTTSFIFYYPIEGATDILYFETENTNVDPSNFNLYKRVNLVSEPVFNGYLERFVRIKSPEVWCLVTYKTNGKLHKSNPIRLKQLSKPTEWTSNVSIDLSNSIMPKFSWTDGNIKENSIYFQVISNEQNDLISGTYTYETQFQFYNLENVVLNITKNKTPNLQSKQNYNFTLMGVSKDNWVNLVVQKSFSIN